MFYFTPETIAKANINIKTLDAKAGGLLCILHCLKENIEDNISYTIDGEKLRTQLSFVFDKESKGSFERGKPSYIIFAKNWPSTFFNNYIQNQVDLLSCAVFFLRRHGFEEELTKEEVIETFITRFNLKSYQGLWFKGGKTLELKYNQDNVEDNQTNFYSLMHYSQNFKSILFDSVIQKSAADLKAAGQIQTLYSGSGIQSCFLLSNEPLDKYYDMSNSKTETNNDCVVKKKDILPTDQKAAFKAWMSRQVKANGQSYSDNTISSYIEQMERGYTTFEKYRGYESVFQIQNATELCEYTEYLFNAEGFDEFNDCVWNKACSCGLVKYKEFLLKNIEAPILRFNTGLSRPFPRNRILFGAPGTGKSFTLNNERKVLLGEDNETDYERVTFHPDYSYANFVGTYKPVPLGGAITYEYVPGPFMRVYVNALKNSRTDNIKPFLLIIEEINRANAAAVFGDIFQLLDRDDDEVSEYPIQASEDIKKYLAKELGGLPEHYAKIRIPDNMFLWATMNSADQGVFPMDTAFKRRWNFTYIGINDGESDIARKTVTLGKGTNSRTVEWNELRKAINDRLAFFKINEDKLLGPYFLSSTVVPKDGNINTDKFIDAFKNKVLMYLFDDAAKQKRAALFADDVDTTKYSSVCVAFDNMGVFAFCSAVSNRFQAANEGDTQ